MRMRKRPNLQPRMEKCASVLVEVPEENKGKWKTVYGFEHMELELGCGKGRFTADTAANQPGTLLVALEKVADAMIIAMERICERGLANVRFIRGDAARLQEMFEPGEVSRIYINFCDPWPKSRDAKHRLTAPAFLRMYCDLLPVGGEIHFKTDNLPLFNWSVEQFKEEGWELHEVTNDLHVNGICGVVTDYEAKFHEEGIPINRLVARRVEGTKGCNAGELERMRNAALTDARGYNA